MRKIESGVVEQSHASCGIGAPIDWMMMMMMMIMVMVMSVLAASRAIAFQSQAAMEV